MGDSIKVPLIVRLQGTNSDIAKELMIVGLNVLSATAFQEAAEKYKKPFHSDKVSYFFKK